MKTFEAYDGQVVFHCGHHNLRSLIIEDALKRAVPEYEEFGHDSMFAILFRNLSTFLAITRDITFKLPENDAPEVLVSFRSWWQFARQTRDYRAIWEQFIEVADVGIHAAWFAAFEDAQPKRLMADPVLQAGEDNPPADPT